MNEEMKKRYDELRNKIKMNEMKKRQENNELLQECIEFTGSEVLNLDEGNKIVDEIQKNIPFKWYGSLDLEKIKSITVINNVDDILGLINSSEKFYVMWDNAALPVLRCELDSLIKFIDDVTAVSFYTWIVSFDYNIAIEFHSRIVLGILS